MLTITQISFLIPTSLTLAAKTKKLKKHNYENNDMILDAHIETNNKLVITVADKGVGITDIVQAREPLFSTGSPDQHSGMGFTIIEQYSDSVVIKSKVGFGTKIKFIFHI